MEDYYDMYREAAFGFGMLEIFLLIILFIGYKSGHIRTPLVGCRYGLHALIAVLINFLITNVFLGYSIWSIFSCGFNEAVVRLIFIFLIVVLYALMVLNVYLFLKEPEIGFKNLTYLYMGLIIPSLIIAGYYLPD